MLTKYKYLIEEFDDGIWISLIQEVVIMAKT